MSSDTTHSSYAGFAQVYPEGNDPTICNQYLPNDSIYNRFLYVIQVGTPVPTSWRFVNAFFYGGC